MCPDELEPFDIPDPPRPDQSVEEHLRAASMHLGYAARRFQGLEKVQAALNRVADLRAQLAQAEAELLAIMNGKN